MHFNNKPRLVIRFPRFNKISNNQILLPNSLVPFDALDGSCTATMFINAIIYS